MCKNKCYGTCEHYSPYLNISSSNGTCKEYEALVYCYKSPCGWYCKKRSDNNGKRNERWACGVDG